LLCLPNRALAPEPQKNLCFFPSPIQTPQILEIKNSNIS
jgi:hypothetical protein